jgi:hypothetical protein
LLAESIFTPGQRVAGSDYKFSVLPSTQRSGYLHDPGVNRAKYVPASFILSFDFLLDEPSNRNIIPKLSSNRTPYPKTRESIKPYSC